jgi:hypothetical protein
MAKTEDLQDWVIAALKERGGAASIIQVAKHIWQQHEAELRASGDLFYSWQYDMRWACTKLRDQGLMQPTSKRGEWRLAT